MQEHSAAAHTAARIAAAALAAAALAELVQLVQLVAERLLAAAKHWDAAAAELAHKPDQRTAAQAQALAAARRLDHSLALAEHAAAAAAAAAPDLASDSAKVQDAETPHWR